MFIPACKEKLNKMGYLLIVLLSTLYVPLPLSSKQLLFPHKVLKILFPELPKAIQKNRFVSETRAHWYDNSVSVHVGRKIKK